MRKFLTIGLLLFGLQARSQCTINAVRKACVNDLVYFTISGSATSWSWDFGTYGNSTNASPTIKFTSQGTVVVSCTLTLAGGGQCIDTHRIQIVPGPKVITSKDLNSDSCSNSNLICMKNASVKGDGGLKSLSLLWGDGGIDIYKAPLAKSLCHHYKDSGFFTLNYELSDSNGCKAYYSTSIHVVAAPFTTLTKQVNFKCDSSELCFTASSTGGVGHSYQWSTFPFAYKTGTSNPFCLYVLRKNTQKVQAIAVNSYGCRDTVKAEATAPDSGISYAIGKRYYCSQQLSGGLVFNAGELVSWEYNGKYIGKSSFVNLNSARQGWNYLKISTNNPCPMSYTDSFFFTKFDMKIKVFNLFYYKPKDTFWGIDLSKNGPASRLRRLWDFGDGSAQTCTTWTKKKYFITNNCRYSKDSIAHHFFKDTSCFYIRFNLYDTTTGCEADTTIIVNRKEYCDPLIVKPKICLDEFEIFQLSVPMKKKIGKRNYLLTDVVKPRDSLVFQGTQLVYKYTTPGYKSPVFWRYYDPDTVWTEKNGKIVIDYIRPARGWVADTFKNGVYVLPKPRPQFTLKKLRDCNPGKAELTFVDSIWMYPKSMTVDWGDTVWKFTNYTDTIARFPKFTKEYKNTGEYVVTVTLEVTKGCSATFKDIIQLGNYSNFVFLSSCGERLCIRDTVQDFDGKNKWNAQNNLGKVYWDFGDGKKDSGYNLCHTYKALGTYTIKMRAVGNNGCIGTKQKTITLSKTIAGIKYQPTIYCSEIRQYFDSCKIVGDPDSGKISQWKWDFGDGSSPVFKQNPAHIYPMGGTYQVRLIITTVRGCRDTTVKNFNIVGPVVNAHIVSDSMGCSPLTVTFGNFSQNNQVYIWEYGDPNKTVHSTKSDTNVSFTYKKPGTYYAYLTGGGKYFNPITRDTYYCSVKVPAPGNPQMRIVVKPGYHADFMVPDTICLGDTIPISDNCDTSYTKEFIWRISGEKAQIRNFGDFTHVFKTGGDKYISVKANVPEGTPCLDSAKQKITVLDFVPDFKQDCDKSRTPVLYFKNTSGPDVPDYLWTIQKSAGSPPYFVSSGRDLQHDFGFDTGSRVICLKLDLGNYCKDVTCKTIVLRKGIYLANVFTPGSVDGFNDSYRVPVYGYEKFELRIFNRWGERIFYSEDPDYSWNGKVNNTGAELPTGTYFYQFSYKDYCDKKLKMINGSINLIR